MSAERPNTVPTGVEPIDAALGGLEPGRAHVVYGALNTGKSTLALQFVVEGLRAKEPCVLVVRYTPEEAVSAMASLGYDCGRDLRLGRLVLLEYASGLVDHLTGLENFSEVLDELDWQLEGVAPARIAFDTADYIFAIQHGYGHALQVPALVKWVEGRPAALTLLVVEERVGDRIVQAFRAHARTVIHAVRRSVAAGFEYFFAFEKGPVKAPPRRLTLTGDGLETDAVVDVGVPARPTSPLRIPSSGGGRTGQLVPSSPEQASFVAEATGPQPPAAITAPLLARSGRPRVLVVDDDAFTCRLVERSLGAEYHIEAAYDGVAGLAKVVSFDPDLVVLDVTLPFVDGFSICRQIRMRSNVPVIIVTGTHVSPGDRIMSAEIGADAYITKPFSLHELALRSRQLVARFRGETAPPVEGATGDQLIDFEQFLEQIDVRAAAGGPDTPSTIVGCTLATNGSAETGRVIDLVRGTVRPDDFMAFEPERHRLVLLTMLSEAAAKTLAERLATEVREQVGVGLDFWTFPVLVDGRALSERPGPGAAGQNAAAPNPPGPEGAGDGARPEAQARRDFLEFLA